MACITFMTEDATILGYVKQFRVEEQAEKAITAAWSILSLMNNGRLVPTKATKV